MALQLQPARFQRAACRHVPPARSRGWRDQGMEACQWRQRTDRGAVGSTLEALEVASSPRMPRALLSPLLHLHHSVQYATCPAGRSPRRLSVRTRPDRTRSFSHCNTAAFPNSPVNPRFLLSISHSSPCSRNCQKPLDSLQCIGPSYNFTSCWTALHLASTWWQSITRAR